MDKLTRDEVLHVAHLARIAVDEEEIEKYSIELKDLMNDIDKIKDVESKTEEILVTPVEHVVRLREDDDTRVIEFESLKENLPLAVGKFVEVPVSDHE